MVEFHGKRVVVTGGAKGIGRAISLQLAREGADLYLLDIDRAALAETVHDCRLGSSEVIGRCCDITQPRELSDAVRDVLARWGSPDILVNNAGVCFYGRTWQMTPEQWTYQLRVNLLAPMQLTRELLPYLLERPWAHILNVSSIYGHVATNRCALYHLTKYGLVGFSESLRAEHHGDGLGVTVLCPGFVYTGLFESMRNEVVDREIQRPPKWLCSTPDKVAAAALRGIRGNRRMVLVSPLAYVLYYTQRLAPGLIDRLYRIRARRRTAPAVEAAGSRAA